MKFLMFILFTVSVFPQMAMMRSDRGEQTPAGETVYDTLSTTTDGDYWKTVWYGQTLPYKSLVVSNPSKVINTSEGVLKLTIDYASDYTGLANGTPRAEISYEADDLVTQKEYENEYYMMLASDFVIDTPSFQMDMIINQLYQSPDFESPCLAIRGYRYYVDYSGANAFLTDSVQDDIGVWVKWKWWYDTDSTSVDTVVKLYKNDELVWGSTARVLENNNRAYFKYGPYKWDWKNYTTWNEGSITIYYDSIVVKNITDNRLHLTHFEPPDFIDDTTVISGSPVINSFTATGGNTKLVTFDFSISNMTSGVDSIRINRVNHLADGTVIDTTFSVVDTIYTSPLAYYDYGYHWNSKPGYDSSRNFNGRFTDGTIGDSAKFRRSPELVYGAFYYYYLEAINTSGSDTSSQDSARIGVPAGATVYSLNSTNIPSWVTATVTTNIITAINAASHSPGDIILLRASDLYSDTQLNFDEAAINDSTNPVIVSTWGNPQSVGYPRARMQDQEGVDRSGLADATVLIATSGTTTRDFGIRLEYLEIMLPTKTNIEAAIVKTYSMGKLELERNYMHGGQGYNFELVNSSWIQWGLNSGSSYGRIHVNGCDIGGVTQVVRLGTSASWSLIEHSYIHHSVKSYNTNRNNTDMVSGSKLTIQYSELGNYCDDLWDDFGGAGDAHFLSNYIREYGTDTIYKGKGYKSGAGGGSTNIRIIGNIWRDMIAVATYNDDESIIGFAFHVDSYCDDIVAEYNYAENCSFKMFHGIALDNGRINNNTAVNVALHPDITASNAVMAELTIAGTLIFQNNVSFTADASTDATSDFDFTTGTVTGGYNFGYLAAAVTGSATYNGAINDTYQTDPEITNMLPDVGSPLINTGTATSGASSTDILGYTMNGTRDIGCREKQ